MRDGDDKMEMEKVLKNLEETLSICFNSRYKICFSNDNHFAIESSDNIITDNFIHNLIIIAKIRNFKFLGCSLYNDKIIAIFIKNRKMKQE